MRKFLSLAFALIVSSAAAQSITGGGGGGGSGGTGTVTSINTSCGISGGPITTSGTISSNSNPNVQSGANYAILTGDCGSIIYLNNASNQIPTIAQAGTTGFAKGFYVELCNIGTGTQTLTPATSTIGGASTYVLAAGTAAAPKCIGVNSDGTNYVLDLTGPGGSGATGANPIATASDTAVNGSATTFMRSDGAPAVQKGSNAQFGLAEGDGTSISMTAGVAQRTALTGDVTAPAGSSSTTLASGNAANLNSGTLNAARMPALTGDCTTSAGAVATTCNGPHPGYNTTNWYLPQGHSTMSASGVSTANRIMCSLGYIPNKITIGSLGVRINTLGTSNIQLALYTNVNNTSFAPGTLLSSTANISDLGTGFVSAALGASQQVGPGSASGAFIWFCFNVNDGVVALTGYSASSTIESSVVGAATGVNAIGNGTNAIVGKLCTGAACQGGSSTFNTWPVDLHTSTWTDAVSAIATAIAFQAASVP